MKLKRLSPTYNNHHDNKKFVTTQQLDWRIKLRRQQRTQQLALNGHKVVHEDLKEYGHPYYIASTSNKGDSYIKVTIRIHSRNVNNISIYATKVKY